MALYSQSIKNFVQGISQQPTLLRFPEQLEEQINGFSTEVSGLQKRVPTVHLKTLTGLNLTKGSKPLVHFIDRDKQQKYMVVFTNNTLKVYDMKGVEKTVNIEDADYLKTDTPRDDLRGMTVADYTFILNTKKVVKMTSKKSPDYFSSQGSMLYVKQGQYGRTYQVWIDGVSKCSHTTPNGDAAEQTKQIDTNYIADQINTQLNKNGVSTDHEDNWIRIKSNGLVQTADGFNHQALINFKKSIQRFSLLPATAPDNYCVKVKGDPNGASEGSYYVKYSKANNVWEECVCPNINIEIDATTMPHALVHNADDTFTFKKLTWKERKVGDDDSNPYPSFIDKTLSSIFFYRNRLGVSSDENIIMSESGEYFNWWMTTANDLLDTDGIDVPITSTKANLINYIVVFSEDLYAFSNDTQFIIRADSTLTPKTASPTEITQFNSSPDCQPKVAGKNMYFPSEHGEFTTIREYYTVQDISQMKNAQDITSHIPNYIEAGVYEIVSSTSENVLFCLTNGATDTIYIYKYLFANEERIQSSWSKWVFDGEIYGAGFIGSRLYLLIRRGTQINMEMMDFSVNIKDFEDDELYRVFLDQKKVLSNGVYNSTTEKTCFNLKSAYAFTDETPLHDMCLITPEGFMHKDIQVTDGCVYLDGDYSKKHVIVGEEYTFKIVFSTFYLKKNDSGNIQSYATGRTQIKNLHINYVNTGYLQVKVSYVGGSAYIYRMTSKILGESSSRLGKLLGSNGKFDIPVHKKNDTVTISVESDMPVPLSIIGLDWDCLYTTRVKEM